MGGWKGGREERREGGREEGLLHHRLLHLHGREERDQRWNPWHGKRREQGAGNQKSFGGVSPLREAAKRKKKEKKKSFGGVRESAKRGRVSVIVVVGAEY